MNKNKYIISDDIDFYSEISNLENTNNNNNNNNNNVCLLTGEPLVKNNIIFECGHSFNYIPLFNEILVQKKYNIYNTEKLDTYNIKCPYCRVVYNYILPYIPSIFKEKKYGVNHPEKYTMKLYKCSYTFLRGKNKGNKCDEKAFDSEFGIYCEKHWKKYIRK